MQRKIKQKYGSGKKLMLQCHQENNPLQQKIQTQITFGFISQNTLKRTKNAHTLSEVGPGQRKVQKIEKLLSQWTKITE